MSTERSRRARLIGLTAGGLLAGGVGLGVLGAAAASAAPILTAATPSTSTSAGTDAETNDGGHRSGETVVTGTKADTLTAAALKAVPGGTVVRVETDADDAAYEVHMTKSDGTRVTVKFDAALKEVGVESGMGKGGGGRGGNDHDADDGATSAG